MSQNAWKWLAALAIGAFGGLLEVATDRSAPGWWEVTRHVIIGVGSVIPALKMTLFPKQS